MNKRDFTIGLGVGLLVASTLSLAGYLSLASEFRGGNKEIYEASKPAVEEKRSEEEKGVAQESGETLEPDLSEEIEVSKEDEVKIIDLVEDETTAPVIDEENETDTEEVIPDNESESSYDDRQAVNVVREEPQQQQQTKQQPQTQQQPTKQQQPTQQDVQSVPRTPLPITQELQQQLAQQTQQPFDESNPQAEASDLPQQSADNRKTATVTITENTSNAEIANALSNHGIIENTDEFRNYLDRTGGYIQYKPGIYEFEKGTEYDKIVEAMMKGN